MDLDKLKESWKNSDVQPNIAEDKIYKMLDNRGKSALKRLLLFEKIGVIVLLLLIIFPFIHNHLFPMAPYPLISKILFIGACVIGFFWEIFKIKLLNKIDPINTDILLSSKHITSYKKYIQYELLIGIIWFIIFVFSYIFSLIDVVPKEGRYIYLIIQSVIIVGAILIIIMLYKLLYKNNIKKIEHSINEIKEFEKDNI